jgi:hypothetical protein
MTRNTAERDEKPNARTFDRNADPYFNGGRFKRPEPFFSPHFPILPGYKSRNDRGPQPRR